MDKPIRVVAVSVLIILAYIYNITYVMNNSLTRIVATVLFIGFILIQAWRRRR